MFFFSLSRQQSSPAPVGSSESILNLPDAQEIFNVEVPSRLMDNAPVTINRSPGSKRRFKNPAPKKKVDRTHFDAQGSGKGVYRGDMPPSSSSLRGS